MTAALCLIVIVQSIPGAPLKTPLLALGGVIAVAILLPILATKFRFRRRHKLLAIKR